MDLEALRAKRERREPYTRAEAQELIAHAERTLRETKLTRAQRSAANKAAWAAGDRSRWKPDE